MARHAYLIMAHRDFDQLALLLSLIDDTQHDIFVHLDRRSGPVPVDALRRAVVRGTLTLTERLPVSWGGYSQVAAELLLLQLATRQPHAYYHLLSGADLPLAAPAEIQQFFAERRGREFVHVQAREPENFAERVTRRHLFTERLRSPASRPLQILKGRLDAGYVALQRWSGRGPFQGSDVVPRKGSQWFSITHDLAEYVVSSTSWIEKTYARTICSDESFLQTLVWHSGFRDRLYLPPGDDYRACARKIDWARTSPEQWRRGSPYVWRESDVVELLAAPASGQFFARKFDRETDERVIALIAEQVRSSAR